MSAHAEAGAQGHEHHGPPIANQSSRIGPTLLGMFLFLGTEAMLFGSFFTAYFFVRVVNPTATILSAVLMLRHIGEDTAADRLDAAVRKVLKAGKDVTYDLKQDRNDPTAVGTKEMGEAICKSL